MTRASAQVQTKAAPARPAKAALPNRTTPSALSAQPAGLCACGGGCPRCKSRPLRHEHVARVIESPGESLDTSRRNRMESLLGADLGHVRLHRGGEASASARKLGALGYAFGPHVVVAEDRPSPIRDAILAHELAHAVQQRGARRTDTNFAPGPAFHSPIEREARWFGQRASRNFGGAFRPREVAPSRMLCLADPAAVGAVMARGSAAGSGLQFYPTNVVDTQVGPVSHAPSTQLNVIIGENMTPVALARELLPLWLTATPFTPPGAAAPVPFAQVTAGRACARAARLQPEPAARDDHGTLAAGVSISTSHRRRSGDGYRDSVSG